MLLSTQAKESIKTALAMTIAYGIALSMDWDRPYWAAFAVAFISLSTVGQSLNKGALRLLGTLVALPVSLTLIALFAQDRWGFIVALSAVVGLCTYMMGGNKRQYFWFVVGLVTIIICFDGGTDPAYAFETAVLRVQETGLGILVYTIVTTLLWPNSTHGELRASVRQLTGTQHELYRGYLKLLHGEGDAQDNAPLRMKEVQEFNQFSQALIGAQADSYEVWELRRQWRKVEGQSAQLMEALERWRESFSEVQELDLGGLLPNLHEFGEELDERFGQIARMLEDQPPRHSPQFMELALNKGAAHTLTHFEKAALTVTRTQLQRLEELTRSLFATVQDIKGFELPNPQPDAEDAPQASSVASPTTGFAVDPDRLAAAGRSMLGLWLAYLIWIYIEIPGGGGFITMVGVIGMTMATMPRVPPSVLYLPAGVAIAFAGILYVFVMPQLSSFVGLGSMIFAVTFAISYLFSAPEQGLARALGLAMFVTIAGISNEQTYNFLSVATTALMFLLGISLLVLVAWLPNSPQPEKTFLRLTRRFFRSAEYLTFTLRWDPSQRPARLDRWRRAFHAREVATLPQKFAAWGKAIDSKAIPGTSPEQVQALTNKLQALTYRLQELLEARSNAQAELLIRELLGDVRSWRVKVQKTFQRLSREPSAAKADELGARLREILLQLEQRVEETLNMAAEGELSERDHEHFYRVLGAYRGLSEALIEYAGSAETIDWRQWRETRF